MEIPGTFVAITSQIIEIRIELDILSFRPSWTPTQTIQRHVLLLVNVLKSYNDRAFFILKLGFSPSNSKPISTPMIKERPGTLSIRTRRDVISGRIIPMRDTNQRHCHSSHAINFIRPVLYTTSYLHCVPDSFSL